MKQRLSGKIILNIILLLFFSCTIFSQTNFDKFWTEFNSGKIDSAEKLLLEIVDKGENQRAELLLAFIYETKLDFKKSWKHFANVLSENDNQEAYFLSSFRSERVMRNLQDNNDEVLGLMHSLSENSNSGFIRAHMNLHLGEFYVSKAKLEKAKEYYEKIGAITDWSVIGPFENISSSGYYEQYAPEKEFKKSEIYEGKNKPVHWFDIKKVRHDKWIDFTHYFADHNSIYYGNTFINSPVKQKVQIRVGTSGSVRTFLNDHLVLECDEERNNDLDTYIVETELNKGWNRLLIKTGFSDINACNFMVRITDEKGFPIENLEISTEPKKYSNNNPAFTNNIYSPFEAYFIDKINNNPEEPENYVLLSELYSLNGKFYESEKILKTGLKKYPENLLLLLYLQGTYLNKNKMTEVNTLTEKLERINSEIPQVVATNFIQAFQNQNIEEIEKYLSFFLKDMPDMPELHLFRIAYYGYKKLPQKIIEAVESAYSKFPNTWEIVNAKMNIDYAMNRDFDKAIEIIEKYLKNNYNQNALQEVGNLYLSTSKIDKWESLYNELANYQAPGPGIFYAIANTFYSMQQYEKAREAIMTAIDICPINSGYYDLLGNIYLARDQKLEAKKAFETAIKYSATNYDARKKLKDLKDDKNNDLEIPDNNFKDLYNKSVASNDHPDDDAVIVLYDVKKSIYDGGASENEEEILFKIQSKKGIEQLTEYWINHNPNIQNLVIEKAAVIKSDGSEIEADKQDGVLVFKSLEINDHLHLKYKIRNFYSGSLANHFWDQFNFNLFYPITKIRYSLISPLDRKIYYKGQNMKTEPDVIKKSKNEKLYVWENENVPSIKYEYNMPNLVDAGTMLFVSTIDNWNYISDWYYKLTRSKLKPRLEIKDKVKELLVGKENLSKLEKVEIIYNYIITNITYSSVSFRQSAHIPQNATDVLVNKIGDCKDMAALFISMLKEINIDADFVLVNTKDEGLNKNVLPGVAFNHAIASVNLEGKTILLDLTAKNHSFGIIPRNDLGAFALNISNGNNKPYYINKSDFPTNKIVRKSSVKINDDRSADLEIQSTRYGFSTAHFRDTYKDINDSERKKSLKESLADDFSNYILTKFTMDNLDSLTNKVNYSYSLKLNNYINPVGNYLILKLPWVDAESSNASVSYDHRKFDYNYSPYFESEFEEVVINLPKGYKPVEIPKSTEIDCKTAKYSIKFSYNNGVLTAQRSLQNKEEVVKIEEYNQYKDFLNKIIEKESTQILLQKQ